MKKTRKHIRPKKKNIKKGKSENAKKVNNEKIELKVRYRKGRGSSIPSLPMRKLKNMAKCTHRYWHYTDGILTMIAE